MSMESDVEVSLRNLLVLSSLRPHDKLQTCGSSFEVYSPTVLRGLHRMWTGEGREANSTRILDTVRTVRTYVATSLEMLAGMNGAMGNQVWRVSLERKCCRTVEAMQKAMEGVAHLKETYRDDANMCSRLQMVMDEVSDFLSIVRDQVPFLREIILSKEIPAHYTPSPLSTPSTSFSPPSSPPSLLLPPPAQSDRTATTMRYLPPYSRTRPQQDDFDSYTPLSIPSPPSKPDPSPMPPPPPRKRNKKERNKERLSNQSSISSLSSSPPQEMDRILSPSLDPSDEED